MGFIRLSRAYKEQRKIMLDTTFLTEYMPIAPESYTKVYLAGLAFSSTDDNELEEIALLLDMSRQAVTEAFSYWRQQEIVNMTQDPPAVEYLPVVPIAKRVPKFEKEKYKTFNDQLHLMVKDRPIAPNEYNEYYTVMELTGMEVEAMLMIIGYCIRQKGVEVRCQYITTVARNMAAKGLKTYERVQEHLSDLELLDADLTAVLKALKLRRYPDHYDKQNLLKWKKELGFSQEAIIVVAKRVEKGDIKTLNYLLNRYYENRLLSVKEIDEFETKQKLLNRLTRDIAKILGTRVERCDYIIDSYISPWLGMGFSEETLKHIADYCFRSGVRDGRYFESMSHYVQKFYEQGLISLGSIYAFLNESLAEDEKIKAILEQIGISRPVTSQDRVFYKTWTSTWKMSKELLDYACELCRNKAGALPYMNAILSNWFNKKITTVAEARELNARMTAGTGAAAAFDTVVAREGSGTFINRALTSEELNAMFDRLKDDEL